MCVRASSFVLIFSFSENYEEESEPRMLVQLRQTDSGEVVKTEQSEPEEVPGIIMVVCTLFLNFSCKKEGLAANSKIQAKLEQRRKELEVFITTIEDNNNK